MKNLMFIAIASISLLFVSNAFGQDREAGSGLATGIKKPTATIKKPKQVQPGQNSGGTISNQRSSRPRKSPNGFVFSKIEYVKKPAKKSIYQDTAQESGIRRKKPRTRSTQKRQYKP